MRGSLAIPNNVNVGNFNFLIENKHRVQWGYVNILKSQISGSVVAKLPVVTTNNEYFAYVSPGLNCQSLTSYWISARSKESFNISYNFSQDDKSDRSLFWIVFD